MTTTLFDLPFQSGSVTELAYRFAAERPKTVYPVTMNEVLEATKDVQIRSLLHQTTWLLTDGMPLVWLTKHIRGKASRQYGPEFLLAMLHQPSLRHAFVGTTSNTLKKLQLKLTQQFPTAQFAGFFAPPMEARESPSTHRVVQQWLQSVTPDIVWVSLGGVKQLQWIQTHQQDVPSSFVAVGAAFDFLAGIQPQAPQWLRNRGGEWLFRLIHEPHRLFSRYVVHFPAITVLFIKEWLRLR